MKYIFDALMALRSVMHGNEEALRRTARSMDLNSIELSVLISLHRSSSTQHAKDLALSMHVPKSRISEAVLDLENKGLVRRERLKEDRRKEKLILTDRAVPVLERTAAEFTRLNDMLFEGFSQQDKDTFIEMAHRINMNAKIKDMEK